MIILNQRLLPEPQVKQIREWLREPAARVFIDWIASCAAEKAADAGNSLVSAEPGDDADAKNSAEDARRFLAVHEIMTKVILDEIKMQTVELKPRPLIQEK